MCRFSSVDQFVVILQFRGLSSVRFGIVTGLVSFAANHGLKTTIIYQITDFDSIKAFCGYIGAAAAILTASILGIPVSTSHCAFGAIMGASLA